MQYPLEERIGHPDLFVGRAEEFAMFQEWLDGIPDASHFISFREREPTLIQTPLSLEKIRQYGVTNKLQVMADDAEFLLAYQEGNSADPIWDIAYSAVDF